MSIFDTWVQRIQSGTFTKSQCQQFATAIATRANGERPGGKNTNISNEAAKTLCNIIAANPVRLTEEHEIQGCKWLLKYGKKVLQLPPDVMDHFDHFEFSGRATIASWRGGVPVWDIITDDGRTIHYSVAAWQTTTSHSPWNQWWEA
jgi:hypothetical protein